MTQSFPDGQATPEQSATSGKLPGEILSIRVVLQTAAQLEAPVNTILPSFIEKPHNEPNGSETTETDTAESSEASILTGSGVLAVVSSNQLPIRYDAIGDFVDSDSGEVCSYDALATRKLVLDRIEFIAAQTRFAVKSRRDGVLVKEGMSFDTWHINEDVIADAYSTRHDIVFDQGGIPKLQKPDAIRMVTPVAKYPIPGLKQLAFWTDAPYTDDAHKAFAKILRPEDQKFSSIRSFFATTNKLFKNYTNAANHVKDAAKMLEGSTIHIGYKIGDDTLLPLISLRKTEDGCEFAIETGQETEDAAYNKPKLVQALRESLSKVLTSGKIDSDIENNLLLPFITEYIKSLRERAGTKTAIEILEFIHGLSPEGIKMKELSERVLNYNGGKPETLELVTGTQNFAVTTVTEVRHIVQRSTPFMARFGGHDQEAEAVLVSNGRSQIGDNPSTDSFTVYMGPRLATFGRSRYYPVYEITRDIFGFVRMHKYDELFKPEAKRAGQEHLDALHMLFIGQPQAPVDA